MVWLVIVVAVVAVVAAVLWFVLTRQHPEQASYHPGDHPHVDRMGRGTGSPGVMDRPAWPDAENMAGDPEPRPAPPGPIADEPGE